MQDNLIERLDALAEHIGDDDFSLPQGSKSAVLLAIREIDRLRRTQPIVDAAIRLVGLPNINNRCGSWTDVCLAMQRLREVVESKGSQS